MLKWGSLLGIHTSHLYHLSAFHSASLKSHTLFSTSSSPPSPPPPSKMELAAIVKVLECISPLQGAEAWDNVGLLLEPSIPSCDIERLVITNDLTEPVLEEILAEGSGPGVMVVSYHPPLFKPFKRLTQREGIDRIIVRAVEGKVAVYSPHTSLDNMEGGINDWLLGCLGEGMLSNPPSPISRAMVIGGGGVRWKEVEELLSQHSKIVTASPSGIEFECSDRELTHLLPKIKTISPSAFISVKSSSEALPAGPKLLTLLHPIPLSALVQRIKTHLHLQHLRLAQPYNCGDDPVIKTAAACAGSGGSVLDGVRADLLLTGEMSHHQVLAAISRGSSVVLCEHTNTERGYLQSVYKKEVEKALQGKVKVTVATTDRDPLEIV